MSLEAELRALRNDVALTRLDHVACLRLGGDDAYDALDLLCPSELVLRDGQMLHTLWLRDDGTPLADCYACRDDEAFILLLEGLGGAEAREHVRAHLPPSLAPRIADLGETHALAQVSGPYAWELMSELVGAGIVGLPYLSFFHEGDWTCFRAGKTGEFGYNLLGPRARIDELCARLTELGGPMGLRTIGLAALDQAALENWFFNIRREGSVAGVTPLELQLQWRLSLHKDFVGSAALRARREAGVASRLTCLRSGAPLAIGDLVTWRGHPLGPIVNAGFSPLRGDHVAFALLERSMAHVGARYEVRGAAGVAPVETVCPPVVDNNSLFIHLQRDSYRTRGERPGSGS